mmetsp:Transcript_1800/g.4344  ORF Transcript_1800/g.4344 Transcript_1800/m.4344 type:complete len:224 (-) Transcript_1800:926-1597(-)
MRLAPTPAPTPLLLPFGPVVYRAPPCSSFLGPPLVVTLGVERTALPRPAGVGVLVAVRVAALGFVAEVFVVHRPASALDRQVERSSPRRPGRRPAVFFIVQRQPATAASVVMEGFALRSDGRRIGGPAAGLPDLAASLAPSPRDVASQVRVERGLVEARRHRRVKLLSPLLHAARPVDRVSSELGVERWGLEEARHAGLEVVGRVCRQAVGVARHPLVPAAAV